MNRRSFLRSLGAAVAVVAVECRMARALEVAGGETATERAVGAQVMDFSFPEGDIRRYGADPTGERDSSTAINAAIRVQEGRRGVTRLPSGDWRLDHSIRAEGRWSAIHGQEDMSATLHAYSDEGVFWVGSRWPRPDEQHSISHVHSIQHIQHLRSVPAALRTPDGGHLWPAYGGGAGGAAPYVPYHWVA